MRKNREKVRNACYHVASNFHPGIQKFICGWVKKRLLLFVKIARKKFRFQIKNICIMNTHFHLIIKPEGNEDLSKIMAWIKQKFTRWLNLQFGLSGTAWTSRFFSKIIDTLEYLESLFYYISQNPVKAKLSTSPEEYPFYEIWNRDLSLW